MLLYEILCYPCAMPIDAYDWLSLVDDKSGTEDSSDDHDHDEGDHDDFDDDDVEDYFDVNMDFAGEHPNAFSADMRLSMFS